MRRLGRYLIRHRTILALAHRLTHRGAGHHYAAASPCIVCRAIWADLLADHRTRAALDEGLADHAAGRWYRWNGDGTTTPNPDWPKDGPQPGSLA